jgi:hypothetical protein
MDTNTYMPVMPAGNGMDFNGGWWLILLFLFMGFGGNGFGYGNNGAGFVGADVQRGFDQSAIVNGINGIQTSLSGNQMADLNRSFDVQTSILQGFNGIQGQLAQCCCDNKTATLQTQAVVQNEGNLTRLAIQSQTQAILDKMCAQEIETLRQTNENLRTQLAMANLAASQTAQTQQIISALTPAV